MPHTIDGESYEIESRRESKAKLGKVSWLYLCVTNKESVSVRSNQSGIVSLWFKFYPRLPAGLVQGRYPGYSARIYRPSIRKNKPKTLVSVIENERFGRVFPKTWSIISGTGLIENNFASENCRPCDRP